MTQTSFPRGSEWRKWDLHVHTPDSLVHNYTGPAETVWDRFIDDIEALPGEVKVLGVNDYLFVDGYERLLKAKREAGRLKNIDLLLPVVEFRLNKFAGVVKRSQDGTYDQSDWNRINLHVIFDQIDPEVIRQQFLGSLVPAYNLTPAAAALRLKWQAVITRRSIADLGRMIIDAAPPERRGDYGTPLEEGFRNLCVSAEKVREALTKHDLDGRFLLAIGKAEWENMKWGDGAIADKRDIINGVDLVFTATETPDAYRRARQRLRKEEVLDALLDCSDAHAFSDAPTKDRIGNCFTWIKADPTFSGLRQAIREFDARVFVGDVPPKKALVERNPRKFASQIQIRLRDGSTFSDRWFDAKVPLSADLVAIIGNKGSGKSALADVTALAGDTHNFESFSFLQPSRFRNPKANLASHFVGTVTWADGKVSSKVLSEDPEEISVERVQYLPQSYLERLCNQLSEGGSDAFDAELRKIIYSHVPEAERLGFESLDQLLEYKISSIEDARDTVIRQVSKVNAEIEAVEKRMLPSHRRHLEAQLDAKRAELVALEAVKPAVVEDPSRSQSAKEASATAGNKLATLQSDLAALSGEERQLGQRKSEVTKGVACSSKLLQEVRNHQIQHTQFAAKIDSLLSELGPPRIPVADVVSLTVDTSAVEARQQVFEGELQDIEHLLVASGDGSLSHRRERVEAEIAAVTGQMSEPQRLYAVYVESLSKWEADKQALVGGKGRPETIEWHVAQLSELSKLPDARSKLRASRLALVRQVHEQVVRVLEEYRKLFGPVQRFTQRPEQLESPVPLDFDVRVTESKFQDQFLARINRQVRGTFSGVEDSNATIERIALETDFGDVESVLAFVTKVDDCLHFDRRGGTVDSEELSVYDQLRKGHAVLDLYDFVFGLKYLEPRYSLTYNKQEIAQLSPGERGLLLLVFYLLVDSSDVPLVIDQPEENLDNQTIYKVLVQCIKRAKDRRQVIMVTHNPNLAVVCDAEQIIYASCDKSTRAFSYESGSIEEPVLRQRVIEVLEGTKPAFLNRQRKYDL